MAFPEIEFDDFEAVVRRLERMERMTHRFVTMYAFGMEHDRVNIRALVDDWKEYCDDHYPEES